LRGWFRRHASCQRFSSRSCSACYDTSMVHGGKTLNFDRFTRQVMGRAGTRQYSKAPMRTVHIHIIKKHTLSWHRYIRVHSNLLRKLRAMPIKKLCLFLLRLSSFFSQSRRPLQLALSHLLDMYLISKIISTQRRLAMSHDRPRQGPIE
jgi:hypothetical protein